MQQVFAWLDSVRGLVARYDHDIVSYIAFVHVASAPIMLRVL